MAGFIQGQLASGVGVSVIKETLDYHIPQDWKLDAECTRLDKDGTRKYDPNLWFIENRPPENTARAAGVLTNKMAMEQSMGICNTLCPVRAECWEAATYEDLRVSVRGGIHPIKTLKVPKIKEPAKECRNGHDLSFPEARTPKGKCKECKKASNLRVRYPAVVECENDTTDTTA